MPAAAVHGRVRWRRLPDVAGRGVLLIQPAGQDEQEYTVQIGCCGCLLRSHRSKKEYLVCVQGETLTCDCGDSEYRPDREGGCKHRVALVAALKKIGRKLGGQQ